jgi:hypothetical protein
MSPRDKHVPSSAKHTTVRLTLEDHEAIHEIAKVRTANNNDKTRLNDIMVDALWDLLRRTTGKTRDDIKALLPPASQPKSQSNVTQMPKAKKKR